MISSPPDSGNGSFYVSYKERSNISSKTIHYIIQLNFTFVNLERAFTMHVNTVSNCC